MSISELFTHAIYFLLQNQKKDTNNYIIMSRQKQMY